MEWVETTGRTVDEAKEAALDQLGVHEDDAEFEVLEEPRGGLFGRLRSEARVRARVRPTTPRPKLDRRDRRRRRRRSEQGAGAEERSQRSARDTADVGGNGSRSDGGRAQGQGDADVQPRRRRSRGGRGRGGRGGATRDRADVTESDRGSRSRPGSGGPSSGKETEGMTEGPDLEEQARVVEEFVDGLVAAFGFDATTEASSDEDDDLVMVSVDGEQLGLLIGPRGQTLEAIQELSRTVLQRATVGAPSARVRVDVGGYRERRRAALEQFAAQLAEEVRESGTRKALEPMNSADRKVVHDVVNEIPGVQTTSEGEDPRRRVVIMPDTQDD